MASECDHTLLGEESERAAEAPAAPGRARSGFVALVCCGASLVAAWKVSKSWAQEGALGSDFISAAQEDPVWATVWGDGVAVSKRGDMTVGALSRDCAQRCAILATPLADPEDWLGVDNANGRWRIGGVTAQAAQYWPHRFEDTNWKFEDTVPRLLDKFVGDYFDAWRGHADCLNDLAMPTNARELDRWKRRSIDAVYAEGAKRWEVSSEVKLRFVRDLPPQEWAPTYVLPRGRQRGDEPADSTYGLVCNKFFETRPAVSSRQAAAAKCGRNGKPNYETWSDVQRSFRTDAPTGNLCSVRGDLSSRCPAALPPINQMTYPSSLDADNNATLESCIHLLRSDNIGEDWMESGLAAIDMRECLLSQGAAPQHQRSRSWTSSCIPVGLQDADWTWTRDQRPEYSPRRGNDARERVYGWPGYVFQFVAEYGVPLTDCVPDYDGLLDAPGPCPSLCENGDSLSGELKHVYSIDRADPYRLIAMPSGRNFAEDGWLDLDRDHHNFAKHIMYNEGPVVGLVVADVTLAACRHDEAIIYAESPGLADPINHPLFADVHINGGGAAGRGYRAADVNPNAGEFAFRNMHSIVVYGWGSLGRVAFYRFSSVFQKDARIVEAALKAFVYPNAETSADVGRWKWYSASLRKFRAEYSCSRAASFCRQPGAGYTSSEDCDGDGVLDHWCYFVGHDSLPTYEAFISSRHECEVRELPCRRSVLPGRTFGCQRPLGWCMNGEVYRRDVDCDGDGHFDHVCETTNHAGFISSSMDCIDTWEEGSNGRKCNPSPVAQRELSYRLKHDSGDCVQHTTPQCFVSHADWPKGTYPQSACHFHVEWDKPKVPSVECDQKTDENATLWLEILHWDIENSAFKPNGGFVYGDRFEVNGDLLSRDKSVSTGRYEEIWTQVKSDNTQIRWIPDLSYEREGWMACLRMRRKIPDGFYKTSCSEIGDDLWAGFDGWPLTGVRNNFLKVECDVTKCSKSRVTPQSTGNRARFLRTTNVCDAGWQVTGSNRFVVSFENADQQVEATFEVSLA